jgi:hypothetical protein
VRHGSIGTCRAKIVAQGVWTSAVRFMRVLVLAFAVLGALAGPRPGESRDKDAEALANAILTHVRECLPSAASRSVEDQQRRVRAFANMATTLPVSPVDPAAVQAAAIAAIDAANSPTATADSLVHAAIVGVSTFLSYGKLPASTCNQCQEAPRKASLPTGRQAGTIWVISLPSLNLPEAHDACSALGRYFEFPTDGVSALVLDLRGNQGGYLPVAACVASQFLKPKTPLFRIRDNKSRTEILESGVTGRSAPITLPLAIFVDQDTESGALAIAAALQDAKRAKLVGESKEQANGKLLTLVTTPRGQDTFFLPVGELERLGGARLAAGIRVDVAVSPKDDDALIAAACAQFAGCGPH